MPFHRSGYNLVWANDFDESSCQTFEKNISKNIVHDSIENVDIDSIPDADIVLGGFLVKISLKYGKTWSRWN